MKKLTFLVLILLAFVAAQGQTNKRTSAYNYLRNNKLDKALEYIEPTITHEKTMNDAKTWYYRGTIYLQIALSDKPEFQNLVENPLAISFESFKKALLMEDANDYKVEIYTNINVIADGFFRKGVEAYTANNYNKASEMFFRTAAVKEEIGVIDTTSFFNAALSAQEGGNVQAAKAAYVKLAEMNYDKPLVYVSLANILMEEGKTDEAFKTIIIGREKYPTDFSVLITETNFYLKTDQTEKALANLQEAKLNDPTNPTIFYAIGVNYDKVNNVTEAISAYKNAIELKPDYFDAIYNLGAIYVNEAATIMEEANKLPLDKVKEYDALKAKADLALDNALPYLEQAHAIEATDKNTIISLKEIYARKGKLDKVKEMDAKLNP